MYVRFLLVILVVLVADRNLRLPIMVVKDFGAPCRTGIGGDVIDAAYACANSPPQALAGRFVSADTLALGIPGMCVEPSAEFYFHAAHIEGTGNVSRSGNEILAETYGKWPRLLAYLERHGVFNSYRFVRLTGSNLGAMGVPLCRS